MNITLKEIIFEHAQEVIINHSKYGKLRYTRDNRKDDRYQGGVFRSTVYGLITQDEVISYEIK